MQFSSTDGSATLPKAYTFTATDQGVHTFSSGVTLLTAGNQSVTVADTTNAASIGSAGITVNAATVSQLAVTGPATKTAGSTAVVKVAALDSFNNVVPTYTGTVHFTSSDGQAYLPDDTTFTKADQGSIAVSVVFLTAGSQTLTATDTAAPTINGKALITINPAATAQFTVSAGTPQTAGTAFTVTVTALDRYNNLTPGYLGKVKLTSSDGKAVLPNPYTFAAGDMGVHAFTNAVTLKTAGSQSVTATDTIKSTVTGIQTGITVGSSTATSLTVAGFTSPSTAGVAQSFSVIAKDTYGNVASGYTGTVHFTSSDANAGLPADYTFTAADAGSHFFAATLVKAGGQSLKAKDTVTTTLAGTQSPITITPAAAGYLQVVMSVSSTTAGSSFNTTITAHDPYGNVATGYTGTITFTSTDTQAVLPTDYPFVSGDAGIHTFTNGVTLKTVGSTGKQSIKATDKTTATITGTSGLVTVVAASLDHFSVTAPTSSTAGVAFNPKVTAQDPYGNTVLTYLGTIHFTSSDAQKSLPADYTFTSTDKGAHTFSSGVTLKTAGTQSVSVADTVTTSATGTANVMITPAAAAMLSIAAPSSATKGVAFTITVTMLDAYNNTATGYVGTIKFKSSDPAPGLPANYTFKSADAGVQSFTITLNTSGTQTITATDTTKASITGTSPGILVASATLEGILGTGVLSNEQMDDLPFLLEQEGRDALVAAALDVSRPNRNEDSARILDVLFTHPDGLQDLAGGIIEEGRSLRAGPSAGRVAAAVFTDSEFLTGASSMRERGAVALAAGVLGVGLLLPRRRDYPADQRGRAWRKMARLNVKTEP